MPRRGEWRHDGLPLRGDDVPALAIAVFFFRFWRTTRDRLFLLFSLAFTVFAANRLLLFFLEEEAQVWVYASRAAAFALIIAAIVDKNRAGAPDA